jgi:transcriptional regulator with XRE-family HTH domain
MARQYKLARKMKGIALTAAAKELGVTQPTLSGWESERKTPSIEGLIRMAKFYGVTTDFLLGLTADNDPRPDWIQPIAPKILPVLHETPVYVPEKGWAFVDAVDRQLRFANGDLLSFSDVNNAYLLPPAYTLTNPPDRLPLRKNEVVSLDEVWVEPISSDTYLREQLRGWYRVKGNYAENEAGQRFHLDFYGAKWLAFSDKE